MKDFKGPERLFGVEENPEAVDEIGRKLLTEFQSAIDTLSLFRVPCVLGNGDTKG